MPPEAWWCGVFCEVRGPNSGAGPAPAAGGELQMDRPTDNPDKATYDINKFMAAWLAERFRAWNITADT